MLNLAIEDRERYEAVRRDTRARDESGRPIPVESADVKRASFGRNGDGSKAGRRAHLSPAAERLAELVFDRYDAWAVVTAAAAADLIGTSESVAALYIAELRDARCWPYRSAKWRMEMQEEGRIGPFRRAKASA